MLKISPLFYRRHAAGQLLVVLYMGLLLVIFVTPKGKLGTNLWKFKISYGYPMMQLGTIY